MAGNTISNVTTGKPNVGGAVYVAPAGTALPTSAKTTLESGFECVGYISEDGVTNNNSPDTDGVNAWGGDEVLRTQNSKPDEFGFTMIEALNVNVLKAIYGDGNVTTDSSTGEIKVIANSKEIEDKSWVLDFALRAGAMKRIVIPSASISELGEITYNDTDAVGYETTLSAHPDSSGNTHYEYILKKSE